MLNTVSVYVWYYTTQSLYYLLPSLVNTESAQLALGVPVTWTHLMYQNFFFHTLCTRTFQINSTVSPAPYLNNLAASTEL